MLDLLEEGLALLGGPVGGRERLRLVGLGVDAARLEQVEALQRQVVDGHEGAHGLLPRRHGAVAGEAGDEAEEVRSRAGRHVDGRARAEHGAQAVLEHGGLGQRRRDAGGEPAGVAPRRAGGDAVAVDDGHLDATLLEEPGRRETDHAGADDGDALGDGGTGGGHGGMRSTPVSGLGVACSPWCGQSHAATGASRTESRPELVAAGTVRCATMGYAVRHPARSPHRQARVRHPHVVDDAGGPADRAARRHPGRRPAHRGRRRGRPGPSTT